MTENEMINTALQMMQLKDEQMSMLRAIAYGRGEMLELLLDNIQHIPDGFEKLDQADRNRMASYKELIAKMEYMETKWDNLLNDISTDNFVS